MKRILGLVLAVFLVSLMVVSATPNCTDSDGGDFPYVPGYTIQGTTHEDKCLGSINHVTGYFPQIQERVCNGAAVNHDCDCVEVADGPDYCVQSQVPEFSTVAAGISLAGAAAGFIFLRRRK